MLYFVVVVVCCPMLTQMYVNKYGFVNSNLMETAKKVGQNLQTIINQWFVSQNIFAKYFRVSRQTVSNWTSGHVMTPNYVLLHLEEMTGITIREMCRDTVDVSQYQLDNPFNLDRWFETDPPPYRIYLRDTEKNHLGNYPNALPAPPPADDAAALREKVAILETTNLYRAGKIEELEARVGMLEAKMKQLTGEK
jgi:hypothetical protein